MQTEYLTVQTFVESGPECDRFYLEPTRAGLIIAALEAYEVGREIFIEETRATGNEVGAYINHFVDFDVHF